MQKKNEDLLSNSQDKRDGWNAKELSDEGSQTDVDEIQRNLLRGDETKGDPDQRDNAGGSASKDTPQGREETKNDIKDKANVNG